MTPSGRGGTLGHDRIALPAPELTHEAGDLRSVLGFESFLGHHADQLLGRDAVDPGRGGVDQERAGVPGEEDHADRRALEDGAKARFRRGEARSGLVFRRHVLRGSGEPPGHAVRVAEHLTAQLQQASSPARKLDARLHREVLAGGDRRVERRFHQRPIRVRDAREEGVAVRRLTGREAEQLVDLRRVGQATGAQVALPAAELRDALCLVETTGVRGDIALRFAHLLHRRRGRTRQAKLETVGVRLSGRGHGETDPRSALFE